MDQITGERQRAIQDGWLLANAIRMSKRRIASAVGTTPDRVRIFIEPERAGDRTG
jgi:hypothetical protein